MSRNDRKVPFTVTKDHITLLKRLCMRTSVCVNDEDERRYWGLFTCRPDVNKKRPFGNSGDPAVSALEELGIHADEESGEYPADWYGYARMLLAELPLAYEAVMKHGIVEPCAEGLEPLSAWFEYKSRRSLEYWREALAEAAALQDVPGTSLVDFAMNARNETPCHWLADFENMAGSCGWVASAYAVIARHAVSKWRAIHPERAAMRDDEVMTGLLMGRLVLEWPGQAGRPDETPESKGE